MGFNVFVLMVINRFLMDFSGFLMEKKVEPIYKMETCPISIFDQQSLMLSADSYANNDLTTWLVWNCGGGAYCRVIRHGAIFHGSES